MPFVRTISVTFIFLAWLVPAKAQAELRLESWKNYGQLAEQGAICASFSALMESQSVLNPDLGALWQERRKFAGAVIRKAVMLELNRDSTEQEINQLISSYRDWVLSSLMIDSDQDTDSLSGEIASTEALGAKKIKALVNSQCKSLFEQGDGMIRQQKPELAYLLEDATAPTTHQQPAAEETGPRRKLTNDTTPRVTAKASTADTPALTGNVPNPEQNKTTDMAENSVGAKEKKQAVSQTKDDQQSKAVQLSIGGGNSFTLTLPGKKPVPTPTAPPSNQTTVPPQTKDAPEPPKLAAISGPESRPDRPQQGQPVTSEPLKIPTVETVTEEHAQADTATSTELIPMQPKQKTETAEDQMAGSTLAIKETASAPVFDLLDQQANAHVNLATPFHMQSSDESASDAAYFAQLGAFSRLENATAEKQRLELKFATLFKKLPLEITEVTNAGPRFYRIRTSNLNQRQTKTVCDLLWPHRIACLVKSAKSP